MSDAALDVKRAWLVPGPHPDHHEKSKAYLRRHWPALADALDRLADNPEVRTPPHYHYAYPHGRPCELDCPAFVVRAFHSPEEPCGCHVNYGGLERKQKGSI